MMLQKERELMIEMIMKMMIILVIMEGILDNTTKVNIHWAYLLVKMISHIVHKMKTIALEELI